MLPILNFGDVVVKLSVKTSKTRAKLANIIVKVKTRIYIEKILSIEVFKFLFVYFGAYAC